ncbi:MAG: TolC family protein [Isosphaeraceae bacterium]
MGSVIARAVACSLLLLILPSCGIPPLRKAEPPPILPPDFKGEASPENVTQLSVEEFYNDPLLLTLIAQGLDNNRELKILNEQVNIAANEVWGRSGAYLPFVSSGGSAGIERPSNRTIEGAAIRDDEFLPGKYFSNPYGNYGGSINLNWRIDIYRQLRNARDAAGQRYNAALERRNYYVTELVAYIAADYYRLMALDKRIENLNQVIELQERSLEIARANKEAARDTELPVLRFLGEVRRNQAEKYIVTQDIIETENRINFRVNRFPQPVERNSAGFFDLKIDSLSLGMPAQLLQNRPDIRQAERELEANGLEVKVARAEFFPQLELSGGVGLRAFDIRYLFEPQAVVGSFAASVTGPLLNKRAIQADYLTANARQLQAIYDYQRTVLEAYTDVINRINMVQNYSSSLEIKRRQLKALEDSVEVANNLFQAARAEYIDVLYAQRDLRDARTTLIDTKEQQLAAIVDTYQALGGGTVFSVPRPEGVPGPGRRGIYGQTPYYHTVAEGETFRSIAKLYYKSDRYHRAIWAANKLNFPDEDRLSVGDKVLVPPFEDLDPTLIEEDPAEATPPNGLPAPLPNPGPGPFSMKGTRDPGVKQASGLRSLFPAWARRVRSDP